MMERLVKWARKKSPWILHCNTGSCNGCDIEVLAALCPRYDPERLGVLLQGSPRHADILVFTGPVTEQMRPRIKQVYDQVPDPKVVVACGECGISGAIFEGSYTTLGGVDKLVPVDVYIPGCPPRPEAILDGVVKALAKFDGGDEPDE